jgi:hypothetical protein
MAWDTCRTTACPCTSSTFTPDWRCLEKTWQPLARNLLPSIALHLRVSDPFNDLLLGNVSAKVCTALGDCSVPETTDDAGSVMLKVDRTYDHFFDYVDLEPTAAMMTPDTRIDPYLVYYFPRVVEDDVQMLAFAASQAQDVAFASSIGEPAFDATSGAVLLNPLSCGVYFGATGMTLESSLGGDLLYQMSGNDFSRDATAIGRSGSAVFMHVPLGNAGAAGISAKFTGYLAGADAGKRQTVFTASAVVKPATVTVLIVAPSPIGGW